MTDFKLYCSMYVNNVYICLIIALPLENFLSIKFFLSFKLGTEKNWQGNKFKLGLINRESNSRLTTATLWTTAALNLKALMHDLKRQSFACYMHGGHSKIFCAIIHEPYRPNMLRHCTIIVTIYKNTDAQLVSWTNALLFLWYVTTMYKNRCRPSKGRQCIPDVDIYRCLLRPTWMISALQHKSKYKSNSISNFFEKKIKFFGSHVVVLVKTFPLTYQLLM